MTEPCHCSSTNVNVIFEPIQKNVVLNSIKGSFNIKCRSVKVSTKSYKLLEPEDWASDCQMSLEKLKEAFLRHYSFGPP